MVRRYREEVIAFIEVREVAEREEWNALIEGFGGSALQSWEWGEFRSEQGWRPLRLAALESEGPVGAAQVLLKSLPVPGVGSFAYVPYGPVCKDGFAGLESLVARLSERIAGEGAFTLTIEPRAEEGSPLGDGFEKTNSVQPRCTFVLEVLEDEEKQLAALPKDTRYGVRRARKQGVTAGPSEEVGADLERFMDLLEETSKRQSFALRPREYYRRFMQTLPAHLIVARREGEEELLAGAIILTFGEEAVYLYGASTREGENLYASYLTQFTALSVAREAGVLRYDLGGIPCAPVESHPLWGVYKFKKKFGGREERYVGSHERRLKPLRAGIVRAGIGGYYSLQRLRGRGPGPISD